MRVLSVASEIFPLIKTGGLADVAGALPLALEPAGVSVQTLIPGYPSVLAKLGETSKIATFARLLGVPASLLSAKHQGLDLLVLDAPQLFKREGGPYGDAGGADHHDNWRRFAAFSRAGAMIAQGAVPGFAPDIVHVHDWQAAMTLAYLRYSGKPSPPGVITIHNIAFQGRFDPGIFGGLELPPGAFSVDGVEYYGGVGYLKAGIRAAEAVTTVSPTYAQEIRTPEFGMGLEGLINGRGGSLHGIVNGIDTTIWDPASDKDLARNFTAKTLADRAANKLALEEHFGIEHDASPLFCAITRLTWQKGMDVLADCVDDLVGQGGKLAVLGSGDRALEAALLGAAARHPGRVGVVIGYDEPLSHLMQAGSDAILIPSRFEPCGLTQLYALRYGCVPVVTRTGGLADTVIDANSAALSAGVATGIQFLPLNRERLSFAISSTISLYGQPQIWRAMQKQGMNSDVSWAASAARYAELYRSLCARS